MGVIEAQKRKKAFLLALMTYGSKKDWNICTVQTDLVNGALFHRK